MAFDPEHRLVVSVVPGARTIENTEAVVGDFKRRTAGRMMNLITSDEYSAYEGAILRAYGRTITPPRTGRPGRPKAPYMIAGDVFVFPKSTNPEVVKAQHLLATVVTSPSAQVAFNRQKGSIPVRPDVDVKSMDLCAQAGAAALKDKSRQIAVPDMLMTPDMIGAVQDIVSKYWNNPQSVDEVVKALQAAVTVKG